MCAKSILRRNSLKSVSIVIIVKFTWIVMIFAYLCVNCGSLWVSSVAQYEVMNRHVYVHNNVVRINLQMLLVKDWPSERCYPSELTRDRQLQVLAKNRVEYINIWMTNFKRRVTAVKSTGWSRKEHEQKFIFEYFEYTHWPYIQNTRKYTKNIRIGRIFFDSGLGFSITVFGWFLPDDHEIYQ